MFVLGGGVAELPSPDGGDVEPLLPGLAVGLGVDFFGEATGTAAAICVKDGTNPRTINIKKLQKKLMDQGGEIGQGKVVYHKK